jgi:hypothetical protein
MKLSTFIKSYKIALSSVCDKVNDWKSLYLGLVTFPEYDNTITFIFSNDESMSPGSLGVSATLKVSTVESISGGLDNISLFDNVIPNVKVNDAGNVLIILNNLVNHLKTLYFDDWSSVEIDNVWFNPDKGLSYFELDKFKSAVQTDGRLFLFGDPLDDHVE